MKNDCNKVKKGMHCITYTLQFESYKIKVGPQFVYKEDIPILGGQNSSMFWLLHSFHECTLPRSELGYADRMTHCGMVLNEIPDSIEFQLTLLRRTEFQLNSLCGTSSEWTSCSRSCTLLKKPAWRFNLFASNLLSHLGLISTTSIYQIPRLNILCSMFP